MPPDPRDKAHLWDILDAARTAVEFVGSLRFEEFLKDRKTRWAIERSLEIVGEASRRVSPETRDQYPEIPWKSIIGLRNVLAHEYGEVLYDNIWGVCINRLPILIHQLEAMGADNLPKEDEPLKE